jgi:UDP-N-acetylglucosamine pyrophosphorylase
VVQIGESYEDKNVVDEGEGMDPELAELLEIGGGAGAAGEKLKFVQPRKAIPVQKLSYSQLQTSALKQQYQTTVNANNLVCL